MVIMTGGGQQSEASPSTGDERAARDGDDRHPDDPHDEIARHEHPLLTFGTEIMEPLISVGPYFAFVSRLSLAFGLVFELPVVIFFLARMGIVDHKMLARNRKFALLAAFLTGAMLTPPDVFSQTALALPFIILYEVGIIVARLFGKRQDAAVDDPADAAPAD